LIIKVRGASLIEVTVALAVLSVGVLSLFSMQTRFIASAEHSLQSLRALHQLESKLEYFRTRANSVSNAVGGISFSSINDGHAPVIYDDITLTWTVSAASEGGLSPQQLKLVVVEAQWRNRAGVTQTKKLTTLLSQYGEFD
jgi:Tfp pilus assembly protein PilV